MITHVFFDFFGTLVDYDSSIHRDSVSIPHQFCDKSGLNLSRYGADLRWQLTWDKLEARASQTAVEYSMMDVAREFARQVGLQGSTSEDLQQLVSDFLSVWSEGIFPAPDLVESLDQLAERHTLAIISNTHDQNLIPGLLSRFKIGEYFSRIVTSVEVGWRKPDKRVFQAALNQEGASASNGAYVGDNWEADVLGAQNAGLSAFYVGPPGPDNSAVTLTQLPSLLNRESSRAENP